MTPEGRVKAAVKAVLKSYAAHVYGNWIVQNGMGTPTLDYIGCCSGMYFSIETKAPGKQLTARQVKTQHDICAAGGRVFVVQSAHDTALLDLEHWLLTRANACS